MNVAAVMKELAAKLDTITGLRVFPYSAPKVTPPAATVALPDTYTYDATYGRGSDTLTIKILVVVGIASARASTEQIATYTNGSGTGSIKATVDGPGTAYDDARVTGVEFLVPTIAGVDYLAAEFSVDIYGSGS